MNQVLLPGYSGPASAVNDGDVAVCVGAASKNQTQLLHLHFVEGPALTELRSTAQYLAQFHNSRTPEALNKTAEIVKLLKRS